MLKKKATFLIVIIFLALAFSAGHTRAGLQGSLSVRVTTLPQVWDVEAVKIESCYIDNRAIKFGEEFSTSYDWVKRLSVKVKNFGGKKLSFVDAFLNISIQGQKHPISVAAQWGIAPNEYEGNIAPAGSRIENNETVFLSFSEDAQKAIENFLGQDVSKIESAEIRLGMAIFEDGTAWDSVAGHMRPGKQGEWYPVEDLNNSKLKREIKQQRKQREESSTLSRGGLPGCDSRFIRNENIGCCPRLFVPSARTILDPAFGDVIVTTVVHLCGEPSYTTCQYNNTNPICEESSQ